MELRQQHRDSGRQGQLRSEDTLLIRCVIDAFECRNKLRTGTAVHDLALGYQRGGILRTTQVTGVTHPVQRHGILSHEISMHCNSPTSA